MRIRPARPAEAELLTGIAVRAKAHWGYDEAFMAACRDELTLDAAAIGWASASTVVAEDGGRVLGFAVLSPSTWRWVPPASAARRPARSPGVNSP
ncbi:hypothetical protein ACH4E7_18490 [Kitasatospora sp. NPDC018058]|uniref:hypothetical protein n=1 Tax=Kitasatospora sp. NPDC018058 TaxID=3364025 RepID=UPI0037C02727